MKKPAPKVPAKVFKAHTVTVKALEGDARQCEFTITTGAVDRDNDTIAPTGWKLDTYLRNPVVLFGHDYGDLPVARALSLTQTGDGLRAVAEFPALGVHPFADTVYEMVKAGFLNATSVGFRPLKWAFNEQRGGVDFQEQELLEFSIVPVPANAEALALRQVSSAQHTQFRDALKAWLKDGERPAELPAIIGHPKPACPLTGACPNTENSDRCPNEDCPFSGAAHTDADDTDPLRSVEDYIVFAKALFTKRGRVLAARNEERLRGAHAQLQTAHEKIDAVLAELDDTPEVDDSGKHAVLHVVDAEIVEELSLDLAREERVFVELADLTHLIRTAMHERIAGSVAENIGAAMRRHTGRLD